MRVVDVCRLILQTVCQACKFTAIVRRNRPEDAAEQWAKLMDQLFHGIVDRIRIFAVIDA
ncbi:hypothetical protein St703_05610 [Sporolactobacillus terrae]|uniref:Uncharacterized protein n=1 Tax=Sporolactobacillus terrae TaxID=269673 RepID=A0A5K7X1C6_9BACL|nr:hypothetical protein St703_05610 [Sporolactobacillus terrae]